MAAAAVPSTMQAIEEAAKGADFAFVSRPVPVAGAGQVLIRVDACGVCGGDHAIKDGLIPGAVWPRIPGHEVCGVVIALGPGAKRWSIGDRVGRGWAGGHCFSCKNCRQGQFLFCENAVATGLNVDGGWAEYMAANWESLVAIPKGMASETAAPLLCAGTTTFNSLRNMKLPQGAWVAVQGVGGLGHLAVQFASKMGYRVIVLSSGPDKESFARELGALHYIDASKESVIGRIKELTGGQGVSLVIATSPSGKAMASTIEALGPDGTLLTLGAGPEPITVWSGQLIHNNRVIRGWASGTANDSEEGLEFAQAFGIRVLTECFPLKQAAETYDKMNKSTIRFRSAVAAAEVKAGTTQSSHDATVCRPFQLLDLSSRPDEQQPHRLPLCSCPSVASVSFSHSPHRRGLHRRRCSVTDQQTHTNCRTITNARLGLLTHIHHRHTAMSPPPLSVCPPRVRCSIGPRSFVCVVDSYKRSIKHVPNSVAA